jgi:hypothetical protein
MKLESTEFSISLLSSEKAPQDLHLGGHWAHAGQPVTGLVAWSAGRVCSLHGAGAARLFALSGYAAICQETAVTQV